MLNVPTDEALCRQAEQLGEQLRECKATLVTAESCTGGWVGKILTDIAGSSQWYDRGFITYTNQAKQDLLGVPAEILQAHGAVSEATARAMVEGALIHSQAQVALGITGIAGPGGGSIDKPVGLVCFAWANRAGEVVSEKQRFAGSREAVRRQAALHALQGVLPLLS
jgi:nicotinamide-nucleotide amidase